MSWATRMTLLGVVAAIALGAVLGAVCGLLWELLR